MTRGSTVILDPRQSLVDVRKDFHAKNDLAYLVVDKLGEYTILCQSLPLLASFINNNIISGEKWDRVSVTGLFENLNQTGKLST